MREHSIGNITSPELGSNCPKVDIPTEKNIICRSFFNKSRAIGSMFRLEKLWLGWVVNWNKIDTPRFSVCGFFYFSQILINHQLVPILCFNNSSLLCWENNCTCHRKHFENIHLISSQYSYHENSVPNHISGRYNLSMETLYSRLGSVKVGTKKKKKKK